MTAALTAARPLVGVSLKLYMGVARSAAWLREVAALASDREEQLSRLDLFVLPSFTSLSDAGRLLRGTRVGFGGQDVHWADEGPWTGEVSAPQLAETGAAYAEIGHAERRRHFGESEEVTRAKTAAATRAGLIPVICAGDDAEHDAGAAVEQTLRQARAALDGAAPGSEVVLAYEPVWAIGAERSAPPDRVREVTAAVRDCLDGYPVHGRILYGGTAGPGTFTELRAHGAPVDGLFLGRRAHDPTGLGKVLDEMDPPPGTCEPEEER
ncbi:triose-phosphate isomerase family protein [Streptomyces sp. NPDC059740]|uniref:triose-phosphate isomerase family protein n=1 Tax=Streptomyces sp. NPDC059740 TaxID=3346926 RepID=UPI003655ABEA